MFDISNHSKSNNTGIVKYNYLENILYPNYKKTVDRNNYIELPYLGNPSFPNLLLGKTLYNTTNIYIFGKLHKIKDLDYDGELVIEHSAITNWGGKVFTCIPLKTTTGIADTTIDHIISMTNRVSSLSINRLLQPTANTRALIYTDTGFFTNNNTVIVFLKPILVRASFASFMTNCDFFTPTNTKPDIIHIVQDSEMQKASSSSFAIETFVEGIDAAGGSAPASCPKMPEKVPDSDVYISCKPSDVSTEDVQLLNMPLTSEVIEENKHLKMMKNTMALFTVIFIFGVISYFVPMLYQSMVISEIVNIYIKDPTLATPDKKRDKIYERISTMDIVISVAILSLSFGMIYDGVKTIQPIEKSVGMLVGGLYVLGWFMITNYRLAPNYYNDILSKIPNYETKTGIDNIPSILNANIIQFCLDIYNLFSKNISAVIGFGAVIFLISSSLYYNSDHPTVAWFFLSYATVFSTYFIYLIDQYVNAFNPSESQKPSSAK